ncbi:MAG: SDR family oxidoreductase [Betaproteobacteria bacterium]|nr:SDR family oxidoreductase [Betaproteobacteria bacterium]
MSEKFLAGRVAVVTGGNRGIGRATALALAGAGAKVAIAGRNQEKLAETLGMLTAAGADAAAFKCDVREEDQVRKLADDVMAKFGAVHILVNNAGTAIRKNVIDFSMEEWRALTDTNITGVWLCSKYFVPHMKGRGYGRIINLTSIMAHVTSTGRGVYSATKHAVAGLTKALALELIDEKITCVAISPGFIATDLTAPLRADAAKNAALMDQTPMHRWGEPDEIASLALYICSDKAAFMTGNDVLMDGGWCAQ